MPTATSRFHTVPAGTKPSQCNGSTCRATIYWIRTPEGRAIPIDCDVEGGEPPSDTNDRNQLDAFSGGSAFVFEGRGVSHFTTCPDADEFRGGRR